MRLAQAGSPQLEAVSMYYSKALLAFAKKVFQVSMEEDFTCKLEVGNWRLHTPYVCTALRLRLR